MSHRDQILRRLREAGPRGVHSFQLLDITPRYAARIHELTKDFGHEITSESERFNGDAVGVRYKLVGSRSDVPSSRGEVPPVAPASSQETVLSLDDSRRVAPSMFNPWEDAA